MKKEFFGTYRGQDVELYTLENGKASVKLMSKGATVVDFIVGGQSVIAGFDTLEDYQKDENHQGSIIGRVANRIANGKITIDGAVYELTKNEDNKCLHGGEGFDAFVWDVSEVLDDKITFTRNSPDGEDGFPGNLNVKVTYTLLDTALKIDYEAVSDKKTAISLTNHMYFNLDGIGGTIKNHEAWIDGDEISEALPLMPPTGNRLSVVGTAYDFNVPQKIGQRLSDSLPTYDNNYFIAKRFPTEKFGRGLFHCASVNNGKLSLEVYTDQPCVQFVSCDYLCELPDFRGGVKQIPYGAFCVECQIEPNAVNHGVGIYDKGEVYRQTSVYEIKKLGQ